MPSPGESSDVENWGSGDNGTPMQPQPADISIPICRGTGHMPGLAWPGLAVSNTTPDAECPEEDL